MSKEEKINEIIDGLVELGLLIITDSECTVNCDSDASKSDT